MRDVLVVAFGGALGCALRFLANVWVGPLVPGSAFPVTLAINVAGSFAIGVLGALIAGRPTAWLFLATGVMGGFTTYSAFSLETVRMLQARQLGHALGYVALTTVLCLAACWLGLKAGGALAGVVSLSRH